MRPAQLIATVRTTRGEEAPDGMIAAAGSGRESIKVPDEVEQLDQLRKATGAKVTKLVEAESSRIVNVDGQVQASSNKEKAVKDAKTGATLVSVKESSQLEQRGPGDEEGVAMAVEELLRQGMMTREEAIVYLQDVKAEMNYIRAQQEKLRKIQELREAINMKKKDEFKVMMVMMMMNLLLAQRRLGEALRTREMEHSPKAPVASKSSQKAGQAPNAKVAAAEKPKSPAAKPAVSKEVTPQGASKAGGSSKAAGSPSLSTPAKTTGEDKNKASASQHQVFSLSRKY
ncbi:hypothetical protein HPB49_012112 [Dermacentor silvarum]|uniref:Uncharacterized protein n=1 Tax=Dermacentor silvarum TaxID=543639 RepID=A0ACB8CL25_DERSI|nr:hypothetical protein HPB49_012112 [Dermacentor silvarum]